MIANETSNFMITLCPCLHTSHVVRIGNMWTKEEGGFKILVKRIDVIIARNLVKGEGYSPGEWNVW